MAPLGMHIILSMSVSGVAPLGMHIISSISVSEVAPLGMHISSISVSEGGPFGNAYYIIYQCE